MTNQPTYERRTDTPEIRAAIAAGNFAEARRLRAERDAALIAEQPEHVREIRQSIVDNFNVFFDVVDAMRTSQGGGSDVAQ